MEQTAQKWENIVSGERLKVCRGAMVLSPVEESHRPIQGVYFTLGKSRREAFGNGALQRVKALSECFALTAERVHLFSNTLGGAGYLVSRSNCSVCAMSEVLLGCSV